VSNEQRSTSSRRLALLSDVDADTQSCEASVFGRVCVRVRVKVGGDELPWLDALTSQPSRRTLLQSANLSMHETPKHCNVAVTTATNQLSDHPSTPAHRRTYKQARN